MAVAFSVRLDVILIAPRLLMHGGISAYSRIRLNERLKGVRPTPMLAVLDESAAETFLSREVFAGILSPPFKEEVVASALSWVCRPIQDVPPGTLLS